MIGGLLPLVSCTDCCGGCTNTPCCWCLWTLLWLVLRLQLQATPPSHRRRRPVGVAVPELELGLVQELGLALVEAAKLLPRPLQTVGVLQQPQTPQPQHLQQGRTQQQQQHHQQQQ